MEHRDFMAMLRARMTTGFSLCVGLDLQPDKVPGRYQAGGLGQYDFARDIILATAEYAVAFKPNIAFFSGSSQSAAQLEGIIDFIRQHAPDVPVILDAKRGDIGNTSEQYASEVFGRFGADAVTVNPYLGQDSLIPFLDKPAKGVIVLVKTSNPGSDEFQNRLVVLDDDEVADGLNSSGFGGSQFGMLYKVVARNAAKKWNGNGNCCVVVGATYPDQLAEVRKIVGDMPILIPGIGAQGGEVEATVKAGRDSTGNGMIINASRAVIFADDPGSAARELHEEIRRYRDAA